MEAIRLDSANPPPHYGTAQFINCVHFKYTCVLTALQKPGGWFGSAVFSSFGL